MCYYAGGTCFNKVNNFVCVCPTGFTGESCEIQTCGADACRNGGTCRSEFESLRCDCPEGFKGIWCEIVEHDQCSDNPCAFGGSCILDDDSPTGYYCICPEGYTGKNCTTIDLGEGCSGDRPCRNGGSCIKDIETNRDVCLCLPGWEGLFCDLPFPTTDAIVDTTGFPIVGTQQQGFQFMEIGIYIAFGVLIMLLFIILIVVACRRHYHHSHNNHDRNSPCDVEKTDSTPNNVTLYKNDFSTQNELQKTHQPLLSISEKVCNKQIAIATDNIKKSTCKDYTSKDYHQDSLPVDKINQECIQYVPNSRHSYPKNTDSEEYFYYDEKPSKLKRTDSLQATQCNTPESSPRHSIKLSRS